MDADQEHPQRDNSPAIQTGLKQSGEILASIFEFAPDAKLLANGDGRIVLVNKQAERMFGYSRNELIGQTVEFLIPERFVARHVEYRLGYMAA